MAEPCQSVFLVFTVMPQAIPIFSLMKNCIRHLLQPSEFLILDDANVWNIMNGNCLPFIGQALNPTVEMSVNMVPPVYCIPYTLTSVTSGGSDHQHF